MASHPQTLLLGGHEPLVGKDKYLGGVLARDGCVYALPGNAERVLKIDPKRGRCELIGPRLRVAGALLQIVAILCSLRATVNALQGSFGGIIGLALRTVSLGHDAFAVNAIVTVLFSLLFFSSVWQLGPAWRAWNGRSTVFRAVDHARGYLDR